MRCGGMISGEVIVVGFELAPVNGNSTRKPPIANMKGYNGELCHVIPIATPCLELML